MFDVMKVRMGIVAGKCESCWHWHDVVCQLFDSPFYKLKRDASQMACRWYYPSCSDASPVYDICVSTRMFVDTWLPSDSMIGPRLMRLVDEIERLRKAVRVDPDIVDLLDRLVDDNIE